MADVFGVKRINVLQHRWFCIVGKEWRIRMTILMEQDVESDLPVQLNEDIERGDTADAVFRTLPI